MSTPEAGWYPDPTTPGSLRFFDGTAWTADVRHVPPEPGALIHSSALSAESMPDADGAALAAVSDAPAPPARRRRRWPLVLGVVSVVLAVASFAIYRAAQPSRLESAFDECGMSDRVGAEITDGGHTVLLDQKGEGDPSGLDIIEVGCFLYAVDVPDAITAQMDATRALDGRQSDEFDNITVSLAYHPDTGIDLVFEDE